MGIATIRIGSRGSQLALWQANHIAAKLRAAGHAVEIEVIRTLGDRMQEPNFVAPALGDDGLPLDGKGIFIKEIEEALSAGRIDLAVHSLKDLPTEIDSRFTLAAIPERADARDAFVCEKFWGLHMLPSGSRIGTTSPRRKAMLLALRPDVEFVEMRGNIDTRLRKWADGGADALVLAAAGLDRLARIENVHQRFSVDEMTPAPGQGALAIEMRNEHHVTDAGQAERDREMFAILRAMNDADAEFATQAERTVLAALGGGCQLPLGAYCHKIDGRWHLHAQVAAPDGDEVAHLVEKMPVGVSQRELGERAAEALRQRGAMSLLGKTNISSLLS